MVEVAGELIDDTIGIWVQQAVLRICKRTRNYGLEPKVMEGEVLNRSTV